MTREELITKLKQQKAETHITYTAIATELNINPQQIYDFMRNNRPALKLHTILEDYFKKKENK